MKRNFDVKVKSTKLNSGDWLFSLSLESTFSDSEFHPDFKRSQEVETIMDPDEQERFIKMVYEFLKRNIND